MIDLKCQIEQRHFLYLSNRTVNAIVSLIYDFNHLIYIVWLTHVWYSKHIESETMQKVLYFNPSRFFSFHRTCLNNKNILFIIKQCLDRWILKLWLTDWAQGKLWRVATLSSDLIQDSNVYICSEVVDSSLKIWITEIKVVT